MNFDQISSLVRSACKIFAAFLIQRGLTNAGDIVNGADFAGLIIGAVAVYGSHRAHADGGPARPPGGPLAAALILAGLLALGLTGCTSMVNTPQGKILSVTERGLGFHVKTTSTTTQTPDVVFGFWSSAIVIIPTATNAAVNSPNFANTFDFAQSGILQNGIAENISSGNTATYNPNATNSAPATAPVIPK